MFDKVFECCIKYCWIDIYKWEVKCVFNFKGICNFNFKVIAMFFYVYEDILLYIFNMWEKNF